MNKLYEKRRDAAISLIDQQLQHLDRLAKRHGIKDDSNLEIKNAVEKSMNKISKDPKKDKRG